MAGEKPDDRFHGYLRSVMLNVHPSVFLRVDLDAGTRQRVPDSGGVVERRTTWQHRSKGFLPNLSCACERRIRVLPSSSAIDWIDKRSAHICPMTSPTGTRL